MKKSLLFAMMGTISFYSFSQETEFDKYIKDLYQNTVPLIQYNELESELNEGENIVLLDAREFSEYNVSCIKEAMHVGYEKFNLKTVNNLDKNAKIVVYCSVGYRSEKIGEKLQNMGFKNVYNLYGGIFKWANEGLPVYNNAIETDSIHTYNEEWSQWLKKGVKVY